MSDYNNPREFDKYGNPISPTARPFVYEPVEANSRAPYVMLGLLMLIGIVGGALYFGPNHRPAADIANAPPAVTDTRPAPAPMTGPVNTTPAPVATPSPAGPPSTRQ